MPATATSEQKAKDIPNAPAKSPVTAKASAEKGSIGLRAEIFEYEERTPSVQHVDIEMEELASQRSRPAWGHLPVFRKDTALLPYFYSLLRSTEHQERIRAAFILGQIGSPESVKKLSDALEDENPDVKMHAGIALACIGDPKGLPYCADAMKTQPEWVRFYAVYGLWRINTTQSKEILHTNQSDKGHLLSKIIPQVLSTPAVFPPEEKVRRAMVLPEDIQPVEIWERAANVLTRESDWWFHNGDYEQTIRTLEASILLDPLYTETYSDIAYLQWSMGRDEEAIKTLNRAVTLMPKHPDAHFDLGRHYYITKRYKEAEQPFRKAVELRGNHLERRDYAHTLERLGKLKESLQQWEAILAVNPNDGAAIFNRDRVRKLIESRGK